MVVKEEDYMLAHYGILGMRWGRRRGSSGSAPSEDHIRSRELKKKKISELSNKELEEVSKRLNLEKNYRSLNPSAMTRGKSAVKSIWGVVAGVALVATTIVTLSEKGSKVVELAKKAYKP